MFDVGDLVVCVDARSRSGAAPLFELTEGRHYRVASSYLDSAGEPGVTLEGIQAQGAYGFFANRFRKIDAPDTEVSRLIRACKPVCEGQPA